MVRAQAARVSKAPKEGPNRLRFWAGLLLLSSLVFTFQCASLRQDLTVRNGDSLYTLALADNILADKGYGLNCIMHFHKRYSGGTWVNDCFRAPLGSLFVASVEFFTGRSIFWPHVASSFISTFLTPVLLFLLAMELFGDFRGAALGAYATAVHPVLAELAMTNSYDPLGMLFGLAALLFIARGLKTPSRLFWAGLCCGLAFLTKEHYAVILPLMALTALALALTGRINLPGNFWSWMLASILVFGIVIFPWRLRCASLPPESKLSLVDVNPKCGFYNQDSYYCDRVPVWLLPKTTFIDRFTTTDTLSQGKTFARNLFSAFYHTLINIFIPGETDLKYASSLACPYYGIPFNILMECEAIVHGRSYFISAEDEKITGRSLLDAARLAITNMTGRGLVDTLLGKSMFTLIIGLLALRGFWTMRCEAGALLTAAFYIGFITATALAGFTYIRYLLICYPLLVMIAAVYTARRWARLPRTIVLLTLTTLTIGYVFIYNDWKSPPTDSFDAKIKERKEARTLAGMAAGQTLPKDAVLMTNSAIFYHYFSGLPTVETPAALNPGDQYQVLLEVIEQYKVSYVLVPKNRLFEDMLMAPLLKHLDQLDSPFSSSGLLSTDLLVRVDQDKVRQQLGLLRSVSAQ